MILELSQIHTMYSTGDIFEEWNEITPQIQIRKFEEQMALRWVPCWELFLTSTGSVPFTRNHYYGTGFCKARGHTVTDECPKGMSHVTE